MNAVSLSTEPSAVLSITADSADEYDVATNLGMYIHLSRKQTGGRQTVRK